MFRDTKYSFKRISCITHLALIVVYLFSVVGLKATVLYAFQAEPFKPFVLVDLGHPMFVANGPPGPVGIISAWATDVNIHGQATIVMTKSDSQTFAAFFDPLDGGSKVMLPKGSNTFAEALALSSPQYPDDTIIVGFVQADALSNPKAVYWDKTSGIWNIHYIPYMGNSSIAVDINKENKIAGYYGTNPTSFIYKIGEGSITVIGTVNCKAKCITDDVPGNGDKASVVGEFDNNGVVKAFYWHEGLSNIISFHEASNDWSGAFAVNSSMNITGWSWPTGMLHEAAYWEKVTVGWDWNAITLPSYFMPNASGRDINSSNEVAVSFDDNINTGSFIWTDTEMLDLNELTLILDADNDEQLVDAYIKEANAINDNGWVAGAYVKEGDSIDELTPCLIIPYDTDNNDIPDYREIYENREKPTDLDTDGRAWLLDKSEQMRVGLHAPSTDPTANNGLVVPLLDNVQTVRIANDQNYTDILMNDLGGAGDCERIESNFSNWGNYKWASKSGGSEIIVFHRTKFRGDAVYDGTYDYIPPDDSIVPGELTRSEVLTNIHRFAYYFANCIDYFQLGNEILGGPGEYVFEDYQLTCITETTAIESLPGICFVEAWGLLIEWFEEQNKSALYGSALAGRPLRIYTPALTYDQSVVAMQYGANSEGPFDPQDDTKHRAARSILELFTFANSNQCIFDQHMRYENFDFIDVIMTGLWNFDSSKSWPSPHQIGNLESGPIPTDDWWIANKDDVSTYYEDTVTVCEKSIPAISWETFLNDSWKNIQFFPNGFRIVDDGEDDGYFTVLNNHNSLHVLWGDYQHKLESTCEDPYMFDVPALRSNKFHDGLINPYPHWTLFKDEYVTATNQYLIGNFKPHVELCDSCNYLD